MLLLADILPNIHPAFVHLPLALLPVALLFDVLSQIFGRHLWLDRTAASLYVLGAVGAGASYLTGQQAIDELGQLPPKAVATASEHADLALIVLLIFAPLALIRAGLVLRDPDRQSRAAKILRGVLALAAAVGAWVLFQTGKHGGELVFEHGLGVRAGAHGEHAPQTPSPTGETTRRETEDGGPDEPAHAGGDRPQDAPEERLHAAEDGTVTWKPLARDADALGAVLTYAEGSPQDTVHAVEPEADSGEDRPGLVLRASGEALLELASDVDDVQVELELELVDYEGPIGVAHHIESLEQFGMFRLHTSGDAALIRRTKDGTETIADGQVELDEQKLRVTVSASGRHLHGYVDGERVAHGHASPLDAGAAGLYLDGNGTLRVLSITVTPL